VTQWNNTTLDISESANARNEDHDESHSSPQPHGRPVGLELDFRCPHCLLSPCVINKPPSWLRGSASTE
jgi:hypothetical protein